MNRRHFLTLTSAASLSISQPWIWNAGALASVQPHWDRTLILIELKGGNDGLNTLIPYADPEYYALRPKLAVGREKVIQLSEKLGLHPALKPLSNGWEEGDLAVALGVGYPDPNLSHFRGIDIWDTGSNSDETLEEGWIARLFNESSPPAGYAADGILLGRPRPGPLMGGKARIVTLKKEPAKFIKQAQRLAKTPEMGSSAALQHLLKNRQDLRQAASHISEKHLESSTTKTKFPDTNIGNQFSIAARLLIAGVKVPVIKLSTAKFDTHIEQAELHGDLLSELASSIAAFRTEMKIRQLWNNVMLMTYSEFGRRPAENNSAGTDHGTAAPHFIMGGRVKGGFYGKQPSLTDLDGKNLKHSLHFRSLYASIARDWWRLRANEIKDKSLGFIS